VNFDGNRPYGLGLRKVCIAGGLLRAAGVCAGRFNRATPRAKCLPEYENSGLRRSPPKTDPSAHAMWSKGPVWVAEGGPAEGSGSEGVFSAEEHTLTYDGSNKGGISPQPVAVRALRMERRHVGSAVCYGHRAQMLHCRLAKCA